MSVGTDFSTFIYAVPALLILGAYVRSHRRSELKNHDIQVEQIESGLTEPPSLHPSINPLRCIGCGACVAACPEKSVLGRINGKSHLIKPTQCIGHGACRVACPENAIELVFGTERRGVDIPHVSENYETNVPGMFIAGELGGMGLIRNAVRQGTEAMGSIASLCKSTKSSDRSRVDVIIVGAGPAGLAAGLAAMEKGLSYKIVEQESMGGTIAHYPRGKVVMTAPMDVPLVGKVKITETTKEKLMEFWNTTIKKTGLEVATMERVDSIEPDKEGFEVKTSKGVHHSKALLLTIGRRGTPRKLDVPGENQDKVVYRLIDPDQYIGKHVLVVGGGDSALEAACSLAEADTKSVTLSYRSGSFSRAKPKNREHVDRLAEQGLLDVRLNSNVGSIEKDTVVIKGEDESSTIDNDAVIVCVGGVLPSGFLKAIGISVDTKYGTA